MKPTAPPGLSSPHTVTLIKWMSGINVWLYRRTGGALGSRWRIGSAFPRGIPIMLLTTIGRRTGAARVSPLVYLRDGDRMIVVASQGGLPKHPLWFRNIEADPRVVGQVRKWIGPMTAHVADPDERATLWPRLVDLYPDFDNYQRWTDREIPVVILSPVSPPAPGTDR